MARISQTLRPDLLGSASWFCQKAKYYEVFPLVLHNVESFSSTFQLLSLWKLDRRVSGTEPEFLCRFLLVATCCVPTHLLVEWRHALPALVRMRKPVLSVYVLCFHGWRFVVCSRAGSLCLPGMVCSSSASACAAT